MLKKLILLAFLVTPMLLIAQTDVGLVARYRFDGNFEDATGNTANAGFTVEDPNYLGCGVQGGAIGFNGGNTFGRISGPAASEFDTEDFTLSFYFKGTGLNGIQLLLSKVGRDSSGTCREDNAFKIRYQPVTRTINLIMRESASRQINITEALPEGDCWYHLALVRDGGRVQLFINGELYAEQGTIGRINVRNNGLLSIGGGACFSTNEVSFTGLMDEFRLYNRALNLIEVQGLYANAPDQILTRDTVIFLGNSVRMQLGPTCATGYSWTPTLGVSNPSSPDPVIQPVSDGNFVYAVNLSDNQSACVATDSVRITVVDPSELDCGTAYLPRAFTPNGDGLNDGYGISNPFAIQQLVSFEIFDRWGTRIFATNDPQQRWDGNFRGQEVNPGVFVYRVVYVCDGQELTAEGNFMVMR